MKTSAKDFGVVVGP